MIESEHHNVRLAHLQADAALPTGSAEGGARAEDQTGPVAEELLRPSPGTVVRVVKRPQGALQIWRLSGTDVGAQLRSSTGSGD
jgi:hypothetical protein